MHCSKSSEGRRLCGSYARGRKRPWHVIVDFSSLSYSYNFRSRGRAIGEWEGSGRGGVHPLKLWISVQPSACCTLWSAQLDLPRLVLIYVPFVVRVSWRTSSLWLPFWGQGYLCRKISTAQTYVMSFLCYTGRISTCPAWPGSSNVGVASCARVLRSVQFHLNLLKFHILFWQFLRTLTKCW